MDLKAVLSNISNIKIKSLVTYSLILIGSASLLTITLSPFHVFINNHPVNGDIQSTLERVKNGETLYIVNVDNNPYIIENKLLLGRFDRTTVFLDIKSNQGQCISGTSYWFRVPGLSFPGLKDIKIVPCK